MILVYLSSSVVKIILTFTKVLTVKTRYITKN